MRRFVKRLRFELAVTDFDLSVLSNFLAGVRRLQRFDATTREELQQWEAAAAELCFEIETSGPACDEVPHALWHFLHNVDVRFMTGVPTGTLSPEFDLEVRAILRRHALPG